MWYYICIIGATISYRYFMLGKEFLKIRHALGKTQKQLAQILCVSQKAVQSYEQGWRNIPRHVELELLLLLSLKTHLNRTTRFCWNIRNCPSEWRENCIVWELKAGYLCWFLSDIFCQGKIHKFWDDKIKLCSKCEVYTSIRQSSNTSISN